MSSSGKSVHFAPPAAEGAPAASKRSTPSAAATAHPASDVGLAKQDLATLDVTKLTPLTPEVMSRQATFNVGTIGHVAHGKSTVVKAISGVKVRASRRPVPAVPRGAAGASAHGVAVASHARAIGRGVACAAARLCSGSTAIVSHWQRRKPSLTSPAAVSLTSCIPLPQTIRFKSELVRNITIKLGYANAKIYRSDKA